MARKLTAKQLNFVNEYLIDLNATQAAIRAGYSKNAANVAASKLLTNANICAEIQKRRGKIQKKLEITQERVIQELAAIAFANGTDFASVENDQVRITSTDQLAQEKRAAIAGIKAGPNGAEVKLHDKVKALELLGKHLGVFDGNTAQKQAENNLFDAINACDEEGLDDLPEIQQTTAADTAVVEDEEPKG